MATIHSAESEIPGRLDVGTKVDRLDDGRSLQIAWTCAGVLHLRDLVCGVDFPVFIVRR